MMFFFLLRSQIVSQVRQRLRLRSRFHCKTNAMATGLSTESPLNFAQTPDGHLFMANGIDPMRKWDGFLPQTTTVGVPAPEDAFTIAVDGIGTITGDYTAYERFLDIDGNPSNLSPISNTITAADNLRVTYTNVPLPTSNKIVRRQILRNRAGEEAVYYVDVDTEDLGNDTFESTLTDEQLLEQEAVALFDPGTGDAIGDRFGLPPNGTPYIAHSNDRMFSAGAVTYRTGHVELSNGSPTAQGIATAWPASFTNRRFTVAGATEAYEIIAVDPVLQQLTLDRPWPDATTKFGVYTIGPFPAERRLLYWSEAGLPDAWSPSNALSLTEDNDEITGLSGIDAFLYVLEREHIYRLSFKLDPSADGAVYQAASRGCVNQRCCVVLDGVSYMLDRRGIYRFTGEDVEAISGPIQDLFRPDADDVKIDWEGERWFHGAAFPGQDVIRWFVTLTGETYPRHALAFNYRQERWWIEEYPSPVGASITLRMEIERTLIGGERANVMAMEAGTIDGASVGTGTLRGIATQGSLFYIVDSNAVWPTSGIVGSPLAIVAGRGKGQLRVIVDRTSDTKLTVDRPWMIQPDATSVYQIGGINWLWRSGWMRYINDETESGRGWEFLFEPLDADCSMDVRTLRDYVVDKPLVYGIDLPNQDGVVYVKDGPDAVIDLTRETGHAMVDQEGRQQYSTRAAGLVAMEMRGFTSAATPFIHQVNADGVEGGG